MLLMIQDSKGTSNRLSRALPSFEGVPIAESDSAVLLRLANVHNHILNVLCELVMNPFFSLHQWPKHGNNSNLNEIYSSMAQYGEDAQRRWKVSTSKTLRQLDATMDVSGTVDRIIDQEIVTPLYVLLKADQTDKFKSDLKGVFDSAVELSRKAETDRSPVYLDRSPSVSDRGGWEEYSLEKFETDDADDLVPNTSIVHIRQEPLCVRPKIFRHTGETDTSSTSTSLTITTGGAEVETILSGVALFPDTGIFQEGAFLWQKIWYAGMEVARGVGGKGKPQSRSTSISLNASPRSPFQPSKTWGKLEYN